MVTTPLPSLSLELGDAWKDKDSPFLIASMPRVFVSLPWYCLSASVSQL